MQEPARDVLSLWPAIEELALNRAKGLPVHDLLRGAKPVAYDAGSETLKLSVESPPLDSTATETLRSCLGKACYQVLGFAPHLDVQTSPSSRPLPRVEAPAKSQAPASLFMTRSRLPANADFEHFVVGPSNQVAFAASKQVAENPGKNYNPLFIYGSVGLGKTHLLQAICRKLLATLPRVRFISCEEFVNQFVQALKNGTVDALRAELREADALIIDDIHFLAGKEQTQEEFFHTFNHLYQQGKQVVLSSDSLPRDIPRLEDRLISRFHWGLAVKIEPPCTETRMAIVRKKAELRQVDLPLDVVAFLAENITTNVRELEGAVVQISGLAQMSGKPVTLALAQEALKHLIKARPAPSRVATEDIIELVCQHYAVRLNDLLSQRRTKNLAFPRHVAMYLSKELTQLTLSEIGHFFGGRDHSTVLHAINKIKSKRLKEPELRAELERFELQLRRPL
ncbi:MAG: chromosomal replication initiator protein DnaA [Planctomycetaceae bacterium]|nr:Chromosomal replication initiator protein DnaA [Planctomycetota bacterium]MCQ3948197.1 chromosomal replication initiator protein DnaA [Planctomycetota bacterium]NUO16275.1 chromosomal replication initiator protein DnaA [Planctomycetaceae bacterium]GIK52912.1 MAG: chromosomal replication initiator protein DnaA [Planctomycetota bacterium]HRJ77760.1 chromosomal replication initiator protein DnaA [Planctomycetota bacterium]